MSSRDLLGLGVPVLSGTAQDNEQRVDYVIRGRKAFQGDPAQREFWCDLEIFEEWIPEHHRNERLSKWRDQNQMAAPYNVDIHLARRVMVVNYQRVDR